MKNKKTMLAAILLVVAMTTGLTYAWFVSIAGAEEGEREVGRLKIEVEYDVDDIKLYYEPGLNEQVKGTVKNVGTLVSVVKVGYDSAVTITSDENGDPLAEEDYYVVENVEGIEVTLDESVIGFKDGPNGTMVSWMVDRNTGDYYIVFEGQLEADVIFNIDLSGSLGNLYQGALIEFNKGFVATQAHDGATLEAFGVTYSELSFVNNWLDGASGRMGVASANNGEEVAARIQARLDEIFSR